MKLLNKKGMTLFELLAVIVILGIIAAIAFPTVRTLINNSNENAFVEQGNLFLSPAISIAEADLSEGDNELDVKAYYVGNTNESGEADAVSLNEDFDSNFQSNYTGYIIFGVDSADNDLIITHFYFTNDEYTINEQNESGVTTPFTRDNLTP